MLLPVIVPLGLVAPVCGQPPSAFPPGVPVMEKGEYVLFTLAVFQKPASEAERLRRQDELDWIKRFRICLTNGYANFEGKDLEELHAAGCELFLYRWFEGFQRGETLAEDAPPAVKAYAAQFPEMVRLFQHILAHPEWLLNPQRPIQGAGAESPSYFFDFGNAEFRTFFADVLARDVERTGYDGVFFDYIGSWGLPADVLTLWKERRPERSYEDASVAFLEELRTRLGTKRIFGNQAYRMPERFHDLIDYDCTESLATSFAWGQESTLRIEGEGEKRVRDTFYRSWDGPDGLRELSRTRSRRAAAKPKVVFCDTGYLQPWYVPAKADGSSAAPAFTRRTDRPAIYYTYAAAKLMGGAVYSSDWWSEGHGRGQGDDRDEVYFLNLGEPLSPSWVETPETVARYYRNGFVLITRGNGPARFTPDPLALPAAAGRVYLYDRKPGDIRENLAVKSRCAVLEVLR